MAQYQPKLRSQLNFVMSPNMIQKKCLPTLIGHREQRFQALLSPSDVPEMVEECWQHLLRGYHHMQIDLEVGIFPLHLGTLL